jgi:hypothetical protein
MEYSMSESSTDEPRPRKSGCHCIICGQSDPEQLEQHCIAGLTVTLCRPCHQDLIVRCARPFSPIWTPPDDRELIAHALLAEADFLSTLAQSRWVFAHALIDRVRKEAPDDSEDGT